MYYPDLSAPVFRLSGIQPKSRPLTIHQSRGGMRAWRSVPTSGCHQTLCCGDIFVSWLGGAVPRLMKSRPSTPLCSRASSMMPEPLPFSLAVTCPCRDMVAAYWVRLVTLKRVPAAFQAGPTLRPATGRLAGMPDNGHRPRIQICCCAQNPLTALMLTRIWFSANSYTLSLSLRCDFSCQIS